MTKTSAQNVRDPQGAAMRRNYEQYGIQGYYTVNGHRYRNLHEPQIAALLPSAIARWQPDLSAVLDLACGSGEVTLLLRTLGCGTITGADPYTGDAYLARTGQRAEPVSFEDIASGALENRRFSLIICSFALHLLAPSRLPVVVFQLSRCTRGLIVVTPHKRPEIHGKWGWRLVEELRGEGLRVRYYHSTTLRTDGGLDQ